VRVGDSLRFLAGRKRVALHLPVSIRGSGRRWRGCGGLRLLREAGRGREQSGREEKKKCGEKCCGWIASAVHLSSPDDAAPEKKPGRSARSMMQPAPQAQARRLDVFRSAGILPEILALHKNAQSRQDAGATQTLCGSGQPINWDAAFSAHSCESRRPPRLPHESRKSSAPGGGARCDERCRKRRRKPP